MDFYSLIDSFAPSNFYPVTRTAVGSYGADGIYTPGATTTFTVQASIQPATGLQRVVGGRDMRSDYTNQWVDDVRVMYSATELKTRSATTDPDYVTFEGSKWIVMRVELWPLEDDKYYKMTLTRDTGGAA